MSRTNEPRATWRRELQSQEEAEYWHGIERHEQGVKMELKRMEAYIKKAREAIKARNVDEVLTNLYGLGAYATWTHADIATSGIVWEGEDA